ncbi:MAG: hypothetical protein WEC80_02130 [Patescibacteria group bacterium]
MFDCSIGVLVEACFDKKKIIAEIITTRTITITILNLFFIGIQ